MSSGIIFIVDDDEIHLSSLKKFLNSEGYEVIAESNPVEVAKQVEENKIIADMFLLDVKMPGMNGLDLMNKILEKNPFIPVVFISGQSTISIAVEALKYGAFDFVEKPVDADKLLKTVENAIHKKSLLDENNILNSEIESINTIIGESEPTIRLKKEIKIISQNFSKILITGETGTGKELVAWALYHCSNRRNKPYIKLNCASIPKDLLESELFGYKKGAFTGATSDREGKFKAADGGTLFLDEIGDLPLHLQAKLLRAIEENEITTLGSNKTVKIDVHFIAATNKNLLDEIDKGNFREDLYHRLNVISLNVPPLRDRKEDIIPLFEFFIKKYADEFNKPIPKVNKSAMLALERYAWPGNVRELRNITERLLLFLKKDFIDFVDIMEVLESNIQFYETNNVGKFSLKLKEARQEFEKEYILTFLIKNEWKIGETAHELGIDRTNLFKKIHKFGIKKPD